jgi:hypothetical protein
MVKALKFLLGRINLKGCHKVREFSFLKILSPNTLWRKYKRQGSFGIPLS